ncbi:MAG: hypothetical protein VKK97_02000 [Synechococcaceae cyanobacterium]|nr:hypothetical protein [Synechococcaceae cyanobacterium]
MGGDADRSIYCHCFRGACGFNTCGTSGPARSSLASRPAAAI